RLDTGSAVLTQLGTSLTRGSPRSKYLCLHRDWSRVGRAKILSTSGDNVLVPAHGYCGSAHHRQQIAAVRLAADGPLTVDIGPELPRAALCQRRNLGEGEPRQTGKLTGCHGQSLDR